MRRCQLFLWIAFVGLLLTSCNSNGLYHFTLIMEGVHEIKQDLDGDLIVLGGKVILPAGIKLNGSVHALSGALIIAGETNGDVSFLNGDLTLEPTARIGGDLNLGTGSYCCSPAAVIEGRVNAGTGIPLPDLPAQEAPTGWALLMQTLTSGSLLGLAAVLMMRYVPRAVHRVGKAAVHHTLVSGAMGLLVGLVGVSLLVTMAYTILLIPVTLLGLFVMGLGVLYGWIAMGTSIGRFGARILKRTISPSISAFFGTLAFMLIMEIVSSIPVFGGLMGLIIATTGLGAVSLTRFGLLPFVPATDDSLTN